MQSLLHADVIAEKGNRIGACTLANRFYMQHAVQASAGVSDPAAVDKLCAEGRDAATFLAQYVVQAELNERGNYGEQLCHSRYAQNVSLMHL